MPIIPDGANNDDQTRRRQAEHLLRLFRGRDDHVGVSHGDEFRPEALSAPLAPERVAEEHLAGVRCLGFYLMAVDNNVFCSCLDFDNKPHRPDAEWKDKAAEVCRLLAEIGITPLVEVSQSGSAAHLWLFFGRAVPARIVREFWRSVLALLGINVPEIYPRQDQLSGKGLGNLVRYPLYNKSHFVDLNAGWKRVPPIEAMSAVSTVSLEYMEQMIAEIRPLLVRPTPPSLAGDAGQGHPDLPIRVRRLLEHDERLAARWGGDTEGLVDTSRSAVAMSIACLLVRRYVPMHEIEAAIRCWGSVQNYDKVNREDWVERVIVRAYDLVGDDCLRRLQKASPKLPQETPALIRAAHNRTVNRLVASKLDDRKRSGPR